MRNDCLPRGSPETRLLISMLERINLGTVHSAYTVRYEDVSPTADL